MEPEFADSSAQQPHNIFRLFTKESLVRIERRIADEKAAEEERAALAAEHENEEKKEEEKQRPDADLEQGKPLPATYLKKFDFPPELYGKPIEDLDPYYHNKYVRTFALLLACAHGLQSARNCISSLMGHKVTRRLIKTI